MGPNRLLQQPFFFKEKHYNYIQKYRQKEAGDRRPACGVWTGETDATCRRNRQGNTPRGLRQGTVDAGCIQTVRGPVRWLPRKAVSYRQPHERRRCPSRGAVSGTTLCAHVWTCFSACSIFWPLLTSQVSTKTGQTFLSKTKTNSVLDRGLVWFSRSP